MKNFWKWTLGILIFLGVIVAIPLGMHTLIRDGYIAGPGLYTREVAPEVPAFKKPYGFNSWDQRGRFDVHHGWDHPHGFEGCRGGYNHGRGFSYFGPFVLLGGLLKLGIFLGLLYGAYWLGRRNARIALDPAPAAPSPKRKRGAA